MFLVHDLSMLMTCFSNAADEFRVSISVRLVTEPDFPTSSAHQSISEKKSTTLRSLLQMVFVSLLVIGGLSTLSLKDLHFYSSRLYNN